MLEQRGLIRDLQRVGVGPEAESLSDVRGVTSEGAAVLIDHLVHGDYSDETRAEMALMIGRAKVPTHWVTLVALYKQQRGSQEAEQLAAALTDMARPTNYDELVELARDRSLGRSRVLLLDGLVKSGRLRALRVMEELVDDPDVHAEATAQLRRLQRMSKK